MERIRNVEAHGLMIVLDDAIPPIAPEMKPPVMLTLIPAVRPKRYTCLTVVDVVKGGGTDPATPDTRATIMRRPVKLAERVALRAARQED